MDCFDLGFEILGLIVKKNVGEEIPELTLGEKELAMSCFGSCTPSAEYIYEKINLFDEKELNYLDENDEYRASNLASMMSMVNMSNKIAERRHRKNGL